jgi:hypothetical protein
MRRIRCLVFVVLPLASFTACSKVHPTAKATEEATPAPQERPLVVAANTPAEPPVAEKKKISDVTNLHWEVTALETIAQLKLTRPQLEHLAKLAAATAGKRSAAHPPQVSAEYQKTLQNLHAALLDDNEARIADETLTLEELRDKENPDFEEVEITAAARRQTPELLRTLGARQVMGYLADFADEFPDPRDKLDDAIEEIRQTKEWQELRDEVAGQVAWLEAGLDSAAETKVRQRVVELLNRVHKMSDDEYKKQEDELARQIDSIAGKVGPTEVIRHFLERSLAELLSNPRLSAAVAARLQKME